MKPPKGKSSTKANKYLASQKKDLKKVHTKIGKPTRTAGKVTPRKVTPRAKRPTR